MSKKIFIIPGLGEEISSPPYQTLKKSLTKKNYEVNLVPILWKKDQVMTNFIDQANIFLKNNLHKGDSVSILGFSFGAFISSLLMTKYNFDKVVLCSLSPYFKEDLEDLPNKVHKYFGEDFMQDLKHFSFPKEISSDIFFFFGEKDWKLGITKTEEKHKKIRTTKNKHFIIIPNTEHSLTKNYIKEIEKVL